MFTVVVSFTIAAFRIFNWLFDCYVLWLLSGFCRLGMV